jgi:hypothetical protein
MFFLCFNIAKWTTTYLQELFFYMLTKRRGAATESCHPEYSVVIIVYLSS